MVIQGRWKDHPFTLSVKENCLTVSFEAPGQARVFSYDYAGRLWTALVEGISYRRGLDGKVVAKWQIANGGRERRWLAGAEARALEAQARGQMVSLAQAIRSGEAFIPAPLPVQATLGFKRAAAYDEARAAADMAQYARVYRPVGILPPDQYMAVVLQATEGCAFNTCTYCTFYRDRPFRIKSPDEFLGHARAVRDFLGEGLSLRRTVFLGDANALIAPMPKLLPLLEAAGQVYDVGRLGGIYAFLDGFSAEKKSAQDYRALAERGLERVYLGLESGNEGLLKFLKKPGRPADALHAVQAIKAGGVSVGVILLLGAGGHAYAREHVRDSIALLNAMPLDAGDLVYFSELVVSEGMEYARDAHQASLQPLSPAERLAQGERIENGLKFSEQGGVPHISRYDIREFVY